MNLKLIFSIYGGYNILLGAAFIFMPSTMMSGAGITPSSDLVATHQIWGAALVGIGFIGWSLRGSGTDGALLGPAKAVMGLCFLAVLVTLYHLYQGFSGPPIYMNILVQGLAGIGILVKAK